MIITSPRMRKVDTTSVIQNPVINITGLACSIWSDGSAETRRKRLYQKALLRTLTTREQDVIIRELERLLEEARREFAR